MFKQILIALMVPVMVINYFGGVVGGIWLLFLGQWKLVVFGLVGVALLHFAVSLLLMVSMPLGMLGIYLHKRGNILYWPVAYLAICYTYLLMTGTCLVALSICGYYHGPTIDLKLVPYLLWAWGMGLGYWQYEAANGDNINEFIPIMSISIFLLTYFICVFVNPMLMIVVVPLYLLIQFIVLPVTLIILDHKAYVPGQ